MSKKYTEVEIKDKCSAAIKTPETFYNEPFVNYTGCCSNTGRPYTEVIAEWLIEHIEELKKIRQITRSASYYTGTHNGEYDPKSTRKEEIIAMEMFNYCKKGGGEYIEIGKIIDYQTPLKNAQNDKAGKIDLLSYNRHDNILRILELKKTDSTETMLRCVLEAYTYLRTIDTAKLIQDFNKNSCISIPEETLVKASPLVFVESIQYKEYHEARPKLKYLMKLLDSEPFFVQKVLSGGYEILSSSEHK